MLTSRGVALVVASGRERNTYAEPAVLFSNETFMMQTFVSVHPSRIIESAWLGV